MPNWLIAANLDTQRFQRLPKSILDTYVQNRINNRKSGIRISGITGNVITHTDITDRVVLSLIITDVPRNTNFEKGDNDNLSSNQIILTDDYQLRPEDIVTIFFQ